MQNRKTETILFVDDEADILEMADEYFRKKGYQVITAANGLQAVKILKSVKIDCCFTDINMPEMDGLALAEHIRIKDNTIPVVVMTSSREEQDLLRSYELGVNAYVVKPVNFDEFVDAVKQVGAFWAVVNEPPPGSVRPRRRTKTP